jgi:hypothetical protein
VALVTEPWQSQSKPVRVRQRVNPDQVIDKTKQVIELMEAANAPMVFLH